MKSIFFRKGKAKYLLMVVFVPFMLAIAGCGRDFSVDLFSESVESSDIRDESLIVVGVSQLGSESVWRTANTASLQRAFSKENGYFMIFDNARQKQENQMKAIRSFISQNVDYIVFSPIMEEGWDSVLQEAKDAGIPVILMDRKVKVSDTSLYTAWVGSDFKEEGVKAGKWLEKFLKSEGRLEDEVRIVVLQGTEGASSVLGRTEGFNEILRKHENWKVLECVNAEYTTAKAMEEMKRMLKKHERIDVVVSQNDDMTFGAVDAIRQEGLTPGIDGDIVLISFDAVKAALQMVQDGVIGVDVECNPDLGGYVQAIIEAIENGEPYEKHTYVEERSFTKEMVGQYIEDRIY